MALVADLGQAEFPDFFRALWGYEPFPWQATLAERVLAQSGEPWPEAIAVPTSAGKTACIDVAVFALAARVEVSPRRIWFVVDRRVIVDEAHERARTLGGKLAEARDGIVFKVAERLRRISNSDEPLQAHLLRGGVYRDDGWARSPLQAAVISSTVDQFGSRLLFRAYGRSQRAWPIQAGLAGNDSLVLLDEAHCAKPFLETLRAVRHYRRIGREPLPVPFHAVVMSATPPAEVTDRHGLTAEDRTHPELGPRLAAHKPARLLEAVGAGKQETTESMARALADAAIALVDRDAGRQAIVVFCNRVATARRAHELLEGREGFDAPVLLTGRMRPIDKDDVVQQWLGRLGAGQSRDRRLERPVVVVATQTLEVGANLDFDGLVSECASLDALRQRMGRLNRMGRSIDARGTLLVCEDALRGQDDAIYGKALAGTWKWLTGKAGVGGEVDFGVEAMEAILPSEGELEALNAPAAHAPVLLPSHLDALVQTWPVPTPSPDPALFLHGPDRGAADVQV
jgi:CRISPR-associated endonuclease/helicase Cas3